MFASFPTPAKSKMVLGIVVGVSESAGLLLGLHLSEILYRSDASGEDYLNDGAINQGFGTYHTSNELG